MLNIGALCLVALMVFGIFNVAFRDQAKSVLAGAYTSLDVIDSVNSQRIKNGLDPLKQNQLLMNAARNKANDMISNNYFAHISPVNGRKWSSFIRESGYNYIEAGENLANGFDNINDLVQAWMDSPTHRDNILNPGVDETGVAVREGKLDGYDTIYVVQVLGKREASAVKKANTQSAPTVTNTQTNSKPKEIETPAKPTPPPINLDQKVSEILTNDYSLTLQKQSLFEKKE
ncbi:MAG: hypothetical protein OHK0017_04410 [Patescibacteria group bacterium]